MVREVGRRIQAQNGVEAPDGDFGLQLVGGRTGLVFRKGSLKTGAVATRDVANAKRTFRVITGNVDQYNKKPVQPTSIEDAIVARRLIRIGRIQSAAHTQISIVTGGNEMKTARTTLGEKTWANLKAAAPRNMRIEGLTLYGRLRQLNDRSKKDDASEGHFWGELVGEGHELWRLKFPAEQLGTVLPLFRKQVEVQGDATYFGFGSPRLIVKNIQKDPERDYLSALDQMRGGALKVFSEYTTEELLAEVHG